MQGTFFDAGPAALADAVMAHWPMDASWAPLRAQFLASPAGQALGQFLAERLAAGATIYPSQPFQALQLTPLPDVRVVILGQDPYHGPGQAHGLAFSVQPGQRPPPSLRNIFKELERDLGTPPPRFPDPGGSLVRWAQQGVLLLNTALGALDVVKDSFDACVFNRYAPGVRGASELEKARALLISATPKRTATSSAPK